MDAFGGVALPEPVLSRGPRGWSTGPRSRLLRLRRPRRAASLFLRVGLGLGRVLARFDAGFLGLVAGLLHLLGGLAAGLAALLDGLSLLLHLLARRFLGLVVILF